MASIFETVRDPRPTVTEGELREALERAAELRRRAQEKLPSPRPSGLMYR